MFVSGKTEQKRKLRSLLGTRRRTASEFVLLLRFRYSLKLILRTTPPLQNWKVLFNFERKNRDKSEQWESHIASIIKRVLTKWRSFFVTKMAYIKRKSWKIRIFYFLYSILRFHCILLYWFQAIFVLWTFFTSPKILPSF